MRINEDKYPTRDEIKDVWFTVGADSDLPQKLNLPNGQGMASFKDAKTRVMAVILRCPNSGT